MPATATLTVQRHDLSLALLPGVTGRSDVFAERRQQVLAALRPALDAAAASGGTVTVVAPARRARTTTGGRPDLGACGYLAGPVSPVLREHLMDPARRGGEAEEPALHVTASAAVALLRLAGWTGEVTTYEVGAEEGGSAPLAAGWDAADPAPGVPPGLLGPHLPGAHLPGAHLPGAHLVVFACARADGVLPVGAPATLALAEQRTHALYREVASRAVSRA